VAPGSLCASTPCGPVLAPSSATGTNLTRASEGSSAACTSGKVGCPACLPVCVRACLSFLPSCVRVCVHACLSFLASSCLLSDVLFRAAWQAQLLPACAPWHACKPCTYHMIPARAPPPQADCPKHEQCTPLSCTPLSCLHRASAGALAHFRLPLMQLWRHSPDPAIVRQASLVGGHCCCKVFSTCKLTYHKSHLSHVLLPSCEWHLHCTVHSCFRVCTCSMRSLCIPLHCARSTYVICLELLCPAGAPAACLELRCPAGSAQM
jgi:hypothetical protein